MNDIKLYRRRYIPNEMVLLKDDVIVYKDDYKIITEWKTIRPKKEFTFGVSAYYINKGYKVSQMMDENKNTVFYYCDIIETIFDEKNNIYTFNDLLADVKVYNDGRVEVVDLDELADAYKERLITPIQLDKALRSLNSLINYIYNNGVESLLLEDK